MVSAQLVLAICALGAVTAHYCPPGDYNEDFHGLCGRCIRIQDKSLNWADAVAHCRNQGGELATFPNKRAADSYREKVQADGYKKDLWIGGKKDSKGMFRWEATSGRLLESCFVFAGGEPNGSGGCLQMWVGRAHKFDDTPCSVVKNFACAF